MGDWIERNLSETIAILQSGTRPKGGVTTESGEIPSLGGENIIQSGGVSLRGVKKVTLSFYERMTKGHLKDGDVLINKDGANTGKLGIFKGFNIEKACINEHLFLIRANEEVDNAFVYYFLLLEQTQQIIKNKISGSAQPGLNSGFIKNFPFKFPENKKEQSTIVIILTTIDQAIEKTEQVIAKYERIKIGLMQDLLTRGIDEERNIRSEETHEFKDSPLGRIPKEWQVVDFGQYVELVHGYQFRNYDFTDAGIPIVKISQVTENGLDISSCSFINRNRLGDFEKQVIHNGDVLMALTGATLGKACFVSGLSIPVLQNYRVGRFEPLNSEEVDKTYLYYTLTTKEFLNQIFSKVNTGAQGNIGKADFVKAKFKLPSFQEQQKIGQLLNGIQKLIEEESLNLEKNKILKTGIMQDLLTGKVRVDALMNQNSIS